MSESRERAGAGEMTREGFAGCATEAWDAVYQMPPIFGGDWAWAARGIIKDGYADQHSAVMDCFEEIVCAELHAEADRRAGRAEGG